MAAGVCTFDPLSEVQGFSGGYGYIPAVPVGDDAVIRTDELGGYDVFSIRIRSPKSDQASDGGVVGRLRFLPSHGTAVAYLALFVALGGTTYAATSLPDNSVGTRQLRNGAVTSAKIRDKSVAAIDVADNSLTGVQIDSSTLGTVPNAAHAINSDQLGGSPASDFRLHCPTALSRAGDLCYEFTERPPAPLGTALTTCARAQLRLPNPGELALVFDHLGASQDYQWTANLFSINPPNIAYGVAMANDSSRQIVFGGNFTTTPTSYRCVTSVSN